MKQVNTLNEIKVWYNGCNSNHTISQSNEAYKTCIDVYKLSEADLSLKEYFFIILLNRANKVIGFHKLSEGGLSGTVVDIRLAYSIALKCLASGIILCHNHPSGNTKPSEADSTLTRKFVEAGKLLDVNVLDHIILTHNGYYSYADEGKI